LANVKPKLDIPPWGYEKKPVKILTGFFIATRQKRGEQGAPARRPGRSHDDDRPSRAAKNFSRFRGAWKIFLLSAGAPPLTDDSDRASRRTTELAAAEFGKPTLFILEPGAIPEEGATPWTSGNYKTIS